MTYGEEEFKKFVRDRLAPAGLAGAFAGGILNLARSQAKGAALTLDSRQRDSLYGAVGILFKIVDMTEEALTPQTGKPTPGAEGGFL